MAGGPIFKTTIRGQISVRRIKSHLETNNGHTECTFIRIQAAVDKEFQDNIKHSRVHFSREKKFTHKYTFHSGVKTNIIS